MCQVLIKRLTLLIEIRHPPFTMVSSTAGVPAVDGERVCVRALSSTAAAFPRKGESPSDPLAPWPGATRAALSGTVPGGLSFELERGGALRARNHRPAAGRGPHDRPFPARPSPSWPGQSGPGRLSVAYPRCLSGHPNAAEEAGSAVGPAAAAV